MWSPITSTLIMGSHDAVLVDPPLTIEQADEVGDWVAANGRRLAQIYITHGHGDHWFGALPLLERFPGVTVRATEGTAKLMAAQNQPEFRAEFWDRVFPGQLPAGEPDVTVVDERGFELEGVLLVPVEVGHTDTEATTMHASPPARGATRSQRRASVPDGNWRLRIDEWLAARHCQALNSELSPP
jgi:glyoxylase-like metal-dependent hydrolase (beta-lactamase superfamily II)